MENTINWPIRPRSGQLEVAEKLAELLSSGARVIFSAPTGWGKTNAIIAALIRSNALPALWLTRSLTLGKRVGEDAALWGLQVFTAGGREKACLQVEKLGDAVHEFCRLFKYKCPYAKLPSKLPIAVSFENLIEIGEKEEWCPYYAQDYVECDILVQSYYRRMKYSKAFVFDEAHNLLKPREKSYSLSRLVEAVSAAREYSASDKLVRELSSLIRYVSIKDGLLNARLFISDLEELRRLIYEALEKGDGRLYPLLEMTSAPAYIEGNRITVFKPQKFFNVRPAVFVSATLPQQANALLTCDSELRIPLSVKPQAEIVELTTKFDEFDSRMVLEYKNLMVNVSKKHRRVIVFAPSERVANELMNWATYCECEPPSDWNGILLLRARGRFSEGVDIPADCVVLAGAPYLPPEISDQIAVLYRRMGVSDPVRSAIDLPMLITTLQCIGRAWRNPFNPPYVVLADRRFQRYDLSEYLKIG
ncbi:MAG: hypothetical protein NZ954_00145 [Thermofilaceae archaeon]|nr:hypothetical protein [Thermofilaceae archaeon]MCX8180727.1 hypothetical protein [Thermofilaceae archaeon]MDW8003946.1 helicase C-terminal domain-containing protein [Thermofilaceae archaeon]